MKSLMVSIQMNIGGGGNSSCNTVYYGVQGGFSFSACYWNPRGLPLTKNHWAVLSCSTAHYAVQGGTRDYWWILEGYHSNESYRVIFSCGTIYFAVQGGSSFGIWKRQSTPLLLLKCDKSHYSVTEFSNAWQSSLPCKFHTWCLVSPGIFCDK